MAKRYGKGFDNNDVATKKPRIESPKRGFVPKDRKQTLVVPGKSDDNDLWGADFDDEAIVEMDFIASQACSQVKIHNLLSVIFFSHLALILYVISASQRFCRLKIGHGGK